MNILLNPSFEESSTNWTIFRGGITTPGFNSPSAAYLDHPLSGGYVQQSVTLVSGTRYTVMMFVNPDGTDGNTLQVTVDPGNGTPVTLGATARAFSEADLEAGFAPAGWSRFIAGSFTASGTSGYVKVQSLADIPGANRWLLDDIVCGDRLSIYLAETALDAVYSMLVTYLATEQSQINTEKSSVPAGAIIINTADILPYSIGDEDPLPNRSRLEIWCDETRFDEWVGADVSRNQLPSQNVVTVRYTEADTGSGNPYDLERLHSRTIAAIHRVLAVERYDAGGTVQLITPLGVEYRNLTGDKRVRQATCKFEVSLYEVNS